MFLASSLSTYEYLLSYWSRKLTEFIEHVLIDEVHIIRLMMKRVSFHVTEIDKSGYIRRYVIHAYILLDLVLKHKDKYHISEWRLLWGVI